MKGTEKQVQYAKDILAAVRAKAERVLAEVQEKINSDDLCERIHAQTRRWEAEHDLHLLAILDAVEARDFEKAVALFEEKSSPLAASICETGEVDAAKIINSNLKKVLYEEKS